MKNNKGFTLFEMLIALFLLTVILAVTTPLFRSSEKRNVELAAVQLASDIRFAQRSSLQHGSVCIVYIYSKRYDVMLGGRGIEGSLLKRVYFPEGIENLTVNQEILFAKRGTTNTACTIRIGSDSYYAEMTVNVGAGRVKITVIDDRGK